MVLVNKAFPSLQEEAQEQLAMSKYYYVMYVVRIGGHVVSFLVDTGSGVSLLNKNVWDMLKPTEDLIAPATSHRLVGVDGSPLNILGSAIIPITISEMTFKHKFVGSQQMLS